MIRKMTAALGLASALALRRPARLGADAAARRAGQALGGPGRRRDPQDPRRPHRRAASGRRHRRGRRRRPRPPDRGYGISEQADPRPLDGRTIFEIGSMSKVFTSLLLADMVQRGEVKLDDPVAKYLPADVTMPAARRQADHPDRPGDPHLRSAAACPPTWRRRTRPIPTPTTPSTSSTPSLPATACRATSAASTNTRTSAAGLLGHVLALRAGDDYETLVRQRITGPLGMSSTHRHPVARGEGAAGDRPRRRPRRGPELGPSRRWPARAPCARTPRTS